MLYDIILPLAIDGVFTYNIPDSIDKKSIEGMRVLAPLGKKKIYTGIVYRQHKEPIESGIEIKDIVCLLDDEPIVTQMQIRVWEWVAEYYMCSIGEVMKAALPSALKLESETHVCINTDFVSDGRLSTNQQLLLDMLSDGKDTTIEQLSRKAEKRNILPALRALEEMNAVLIGERVEDKYRPKTEVWVSLAPQFTDNEQGLQLILNSLDKAKKQQQLLMGFLGLAENKGSVRREELLALTGINASVLKALTDKGILQQQQHQIERRKAHNTSATAKQLNEEQQKAFVKIKELWQDKRTVLLHGVTGSGKTEIYIHLISEVIRSGKQVLYLVPEIALTTQLTERLQAVFGTQLCVYHSRFSDNERAETYRNLLHGKCQIVLGVRSSLFLPFNNLGLIIVDEEHDSSYKQQDPAPRYHARSTAIMLAHFTKAPLLLGTATPAIETYYNALQGKYGLVELNSRHGNIELPKITIVDLLEKYKRKEVSGHFSDPVVKKISDEIGENRQVIVFQNRRGYAPWVECKECAYVPKCVNCDVSLTLHKRQGTLVCHYCGYTISLPQVCPACGQPTLSDHGLGTEKIEDELHELFPKASIARMDLDTTRRKNSYQRIIDDFAEHKTDILVGTQMVSKGLHFDDVSTVAVLNASSMMNQPDFRSYERAFQLLEQVSGRAGRKQRQGEVIIQATDPESTLLKQVAAHDYKAFYEQQIGERYDFRYPPFCRLIAITIKHRDLHKVDEAANLLQQRLHTVFTRRCSRVMQPAIGKMQNFYIRNILLKIEADAPYSTAKHLLQQQIDELRQTEPGKNALIQVDVDPM